MLVQQCLCLDNDSPPRLGAAAAAAADAAAVLPEDLVLQMRHEHDFLLSPLTLALFPITSYRPATLCFHSCPSLVAATPFLADFILQLLLTAAIPCDCRLPLLLLLRRPRARPPLSTSAAAPGPTLIFLQRKMEDGKMGSSFLSRPGNSFDVPSSKSRPPLQPMRQRQASSARDFFAARSYASRYSHAVAARLHTQAVSIDFPPAFPS